MAYAQLKTAALVIAATLSWTSAARACDGAGVILRIEGLPQNVVITRAEAGATSTVTRPRVLEVICRSDVVHTVGTTSIVLSIDGSGTVKVDQRADYTVPARGGAPSLVGNAYRAINDQVMPDMKRLPWNVRLKGGGSEFGFALPELGAGSQQVQAGSRSLLVRLVGGIAPYKVDLVDANGALIASQTSTSREVVLAGVPLKAGAYRLKASDTTPLGIEAPITVVNGPPPTDTSYAGLSDPEIRSALVATALARSSPANWSFEAELELQAAPANGLDRDKVYELIESYSTD